MKIKIMSIKKKDSKDLLTDLVVLIERTKTEVVSHVNSSLTVLFWHIGQRILIHDL